MIDIDKFETLLIEGIENSYNDAYSFSGDISPKIKPEYLFTVNIAKSIKKINDENKSYGYPLIIKLEEPTSKFATNCVPLRSNNTNIFDIKQRSLHNSPSRNGKVDIAVYQSTENFDSPPFAVIEVKGFVNSFTSLLTKDIRRNLEFHQINDLDTGKSRLERSYIACIYQDKDCVSTLEKNLGIKKVEDLILKMPVLHEIDKNKISYKVIAQTISDHLIDPQLNHPIEIKEDIYGNRHHYIGILIKFENIKNNILCNQ